MSPFKYIYIKTFFLVTILFLTTSQVAYALAPVGKFTYLEGRVDITRAKKKAFPAKLGMPVYVGDIIRAKSNSRAEITFNDGNILRCAQNTRIQITEYLVGKNRSSRTIQLFRGNIQNIVKKTWASKISKFLKTHKYEVHTPFAVVGVKGTNFFTFHSRLGSGAIFKEGVGYCYAKNMPERRVFVRAGQKVFIPSPNVPPKVGPASKTEIKKFESQTAPKKKGKGKGRKKAGVVGKKRGKKEKKGKGAKGEGGKKRGLGEKRVKREKRAKGKGRPEGKVGGKKEAGIGKGKTGAKKGTIFTPEKGALEEGKRMEIKKGGGSTVVFHTGGAETGGKTEVYIPVTESKKEAKGIKEEFIQPATTGGTTTGETTTGRTTGETTTGETISGETTTGGTTTGETTTGGTTGETTGGPTTGGTTGGVVAGGGGPVDTTPPEIYVKVVPEEENGKSKIEISSNEPATYSWTLDSSSGSSDTIEDVSEGSHTLTVTATDNAGNISRKEYSLRIERYGLRNYSTPNVTGKGSDYSGTMAGELSAVIGNTETEGLNGSYQVSMDGQYSGSHSDSFELKGGSYTTDSSDNWNGYYFFSASGNYSGSNLNGSSYLRVLTKKTYGEGSGDLSGSYNSQNSTWQATSEGTFDCWALRYSGEIGWSNSWSEGPYSNLFGDNGSGGFIDVGDLSFPIIGGIKSIWSLPDETPDIHMLGEYSLDNQDYVPPYIWVANIYSYNWDTQTYITYDGGAFFGFTGGVWLPSGILGDTVAIYMDPDKNVGYISGSLNNGEYFKVGSSGMLYLEGQWSGIQEKGTYANNEPSDLYNSLVKTSSYMSFKFKGKFLDGSGNIEGISLYMDGSSEGGWIRYIQGEPWGIYAFVINGYYPGSFDNPNNQTSWSGEIGGEGEFEDFGYWIGSISGDLDPDNKMLSGVFNGEFLTQTKYGTMEGNFYGYYNNDKWAGISIGIYEGRRLSFSSQIQNGLLSSLTAATLNKGIWKNSFTGEKQEYEYISEGYGWGIKDYVNEPQRKVTIYFPDKKFIELTSNNLGISLYISNQETWSDITTVGNSPGDGWTQTESSTAQTNILDSAGSFDAILGGYMPEEGPADLWSSTNENPARIKLMGEYNSLLDKYASSSLLLESEIVSYNTETSTYTTPDGGAYWGWIGGYSYPVGEDWGLDGYLVSLYIDLNGNAGILHGNFSGNDYRSILMFNTNGEIWAEKKVQNIGIPASNLSSSLSRGYIYGKMSGYFDDDKSNTYILGNCTGYTAYISGQNWGIYKLTFGMGNYYNNLSYNNFTARAGGDIIFSDKEIGFWIAYMGGDLRDTLDSYLSGEFLTMRSKGQIHDTFQGTIGTYSKDNNTWQAISLGSWEKESDLSFASWITMDVYEYNGSDFVIPQDVKPPAFQGILGGVDSIWSATESSPANFDLLGRTNTPSSGLYLFRNTFGPSFVSWNIEDSTYTTYDNGAYAGLIGGILNNGNISGLITAIYVDAPITTSKTGVIIGDFGAAIYPEIGMWGKLNENEGNYMYPVELGTTGLQASDLISNLILYKISYDYNPISSDSSGCSQAGGSINFSYYNYPVAIFFDTDKNGIPDLDNNFCIWQHMISGTYSGSTSDTWEAYLLLSKDEWMAVFDGNRWTDNQLKADVHGAWVSWDQAVTGVSGGKLLGTFDPDTMSWQAIAQEVRIETKRFLQMVQNGETDKLQKLNIPCFEIGKTTLTGSGGNITSVTMQDVTFFANQAGGVPKIWATGNVYGSFSGNPLGSTAYLNSQSGDTAQFTNVQFQMNYWNTDKSTWGAKISGNNGTIGSYTGMNMKGVAAGNFDSSSFFGTAAGIVRPASSGGGLSD